MHIAAAAQERQTLNLIAEGQSSRQIATEVYLAEKTVKNYVSIVLAKLGMERRTQGASYAVRHYERLAEKQRRDQTGT